VFGPESLLFGIITGAATRTAMNRSFERHLSYLDECGLGEPMLGTIRGDGFVPAEIVEATCR
jgi:hypothetical protein